MTAATPGQAADLPVLAAYAAFYAADDAVAANEWAQHTEEFRDRWRRTIAAAQEPQAAAGEVVHLSPRDATYVTPCCGQTPFDLTRTDRMTNDPSLVTCGRPEPKPAPEPPAMTPAVVRPYPGGTIVLAVREGASDESVASAIEALTAATEAEGVTVVTVRGVEALRVWEPPPAPELAAAMAALTKVVASHERVMYAAAIDIRRGQPGEARRLLGEQLDGWDGPQWDGTETGAQYLERTREGS